jgi:diacylglycerol kinase (ATP)
VRVTLMHNPGAGKQAMTPDALKKLLAAEGHEVRYQSAKEDGWKKALKKPADLVVVAGGDGTVARVTRRMVGRGIPMALLPSGTANNIARSLGLVQRPFEELVRAWPDARRVKLDVGVARGPWGERYFVEGIGAGLFARLLAKPAKKVKKSRRPVEGGLERLRKVAESYEPLEVRAKLDGQDISGRYLLLEALNLRYVGPNLHLAHDSNPGDGQFDVIMATEEERSRLVYYLEHWQDNRDRLAMLPTRRGRRLQIEWTGFELHIDDKLKPKEDAKPKEIAGPVDARLDGASVEFLVPEARKG